MGRDTFIFKKVSRDGTPAGSADGARNRTVLVAVVVAVVVIALLLFFVL